ncbi:hypothetical protein Tco_0990618 [Tanacetum coccineum]|uniref:Uncharacterized protein n=1 Tax=Tanacetum coccineum TaxID=301880 RepID=A0ABQ5EX84_9ASTR
MTISNMLNKKLQDDHWNEICYQLLKHMTKQEKECMRTPRPTLYEHNETPSGSIYWEPHVEGIPIPVEGTYYGTIDEAFRYVYKYAEIACLEVKKGGPTGKQKSGAVQHKTFIVTKKISLVIPFESYEISLESHVILVESQDSSGISCDSTESHQISLVIPFESYEISLESHVILLFSQVISLKSQMLYVESHKILFESHEIQSESYEIQSE